MNDDPHWAGAMGRTWAGLTQATDRQLEELGRTAIARLAPERGERVIDLGCGAGWTSRELGRLVGPDGAITAIDISPDLAATVRARTADMPQVSVIEADAAAHPFAPEGHDALFSRLGCMFFANPAAAFANIRSGLRPDARALLAAFASPADNPWAMLPARVADDVMGKAPPPSAGTPGPFGWAERAVWQTALGAAGFREIGAETIDLRFALGAGDEPDPVVRAIAVISSIGVVARRLKALDPGDAARLRPALEAALREALAPHVEDGWVRLPARLWLISASA